MSSDETESTESFKRATGIALKAIGHCAELEVAFAAQEGGVSSERVILPSLSAHPTNEERTLSRGAADAAAVKLRYHDPKLHQAARPATTQAGTLFDILEQTRCEALGTHRLAGLGSNITARLAAQCLQGEALTAPTKIPMASILHLIAHEQLSGTEVPQEVRETLDHWKPLIDAKIAPHMVKLKELLPDQEAFAREAIDLLASLHLVKKQDKDAPPEDSLPKDEPPPSDENLPQDNEEEQQQTPSPDTDSADKESDAETAREQDGTQTDEEEEGDEESLASSNAPEAFGPVTTYRAYTTAFDEIIKAQDLCPPQELARLRRLLDYQVRHSQNIIIRLANKLQRRLMAQQSRAWDFDLEEGILDAARLARVVANPMLPLSFKMEKDTDFRDTVVTLLIDNSGSMRGRPITLAAISADILARTLERCGVKTEILGFTTRGWKGGRAREQWVTDGKTPQPGRLNDVRHIIYKDADVPWRRAKTHLGLMLREGLLKENIDGEALLWAHGRLLARPEDRRILMVISDGAPVDDSTLSANPQNYLDLHLRTVIDWIERKSNVELIAIGIGHDVTRYYKRAVTLSDVEQLGGTITEQLAGLFQKG
ncbi:MAG: cobaltochelatase subunit CobT [Alphaproteobacteria bacterium]|nr:cobaltochelatase subunit CobT [Alphaproteobacteria bacterium]